MIFLLLLMHVNALLVYREIMFHFFGMLSVGVKSFNVGSGSFFYKASWIKFRSVIGGKPSWKLMGKSWNLFQRKNEIEREWERKFH